MRPPIPRSLRWIDQHWAAIGKIFPGCTMDWLYQEAGAARLKHHQWMLTRPTYLAIARDLHRVLTADGDVIIASVTENAKFPDGPQRALALRFFRHLQGPNGAEVALFLVATASEMLGIAPFCAYEEAALVPWTAAALAEAVPHYGNSYNLLINVVVQTILWILGYFPYTTLRQRITASHDLAFWIDMTPPEVEHRLLLRQYCVGINTELKRISRHPSSR